MASATSPRPRALAACVTFAALWWLADLAWLRAGTPDPLDDLWDYGVVARSLLEGHGFRTTSIMPAVWSLRDAANTVPVLVHGPLVSALLAPPLAVLGPGALDHAAWLAAAFAVLGAALTFRLAARRFGAPAGAAASLLWTLSPLTLRAVHHDIALVMGACLLALSLDLLLRDSPRPALAGAALGLTYLARPEMLLVAPVVALAARPAALRFLGAFALLAGPWWIHNALAAGNPFFNLSSYMLIGYTRERPELSPLRDFALPPDRLREAFMAALPRLPMEKWAELYPHAMKRALLAPSGGTGWLAALGLAAGLWRREHRRWTALAAVLLSVPVVIQTVTLFDSRYLVPFLPLQAALAALGLEAILARAPGWARTARLRVGAALLLALPSALPALRGAAAESRAFALRLARDREALAIHRARADVLEPPLFTDCPDFAAWETGRSVLWVTRRELARLAGRPDPAGERPATGPGAEAWFEEGPGVPGAER